MLRRGGETLIMKTDIRTGLVDMMGRWREPNKDPAKMRERYYSMGCEDCVTVSSAAPPRTSFGFAAWYPFER